jgi:ubiquitin carboxyl-terminal hydrolase 10
VTPATHTQAKQPQRPTAAIPVVPVIPKTVSRASSGTAISEHKVAELTVTQPSTEVSEQPAPTSEADKSTSGQDEVEPASPTAKAPPKLWTGLFKAPIATPTIPANGVQPNSLTPASASVFTKPNSESLADALRTFSASPRDSKLAFIKPRGLVNTGNMCYMNSVSDIEWEIFVHRLIRKQVLQVLIFCIPFYNFLDEVGKRAAHSFKSDTPLIDAM